MIDFKIEIAVFKSDIKLPNRKITIWNFRSKKVFSTFVSEVSKRSELRENYFLLVNVLLMYSCMSLCFIFVKKCLRL